MRGWVADIACAAAAFFVCWYCWGLMAPLIAAMPAGAR